MSIERKENCPECDAAIGELHEYGCPLETCPGCGLFLDDECEEEHERSDCERMAFSG